MSSPRVVSNIELPSGNYRLYCWKVRNGSSVRVGETVAVAVPKDEAPTASEAPVTSHPTDSSMNVPAATVSSTSKSLYKRPTKRRRPGVSPVPDAAPAAASASTGSTDVTEPATKRQSADRNVNVVAKADGILRMGRPKADHQNLIMIGYIEECQHPTVIENLCAVCGQSVSTKQRPSTESIAAKSSGSSTNETAKMSRVTVSGLTVTVSDQEGQRMAKHDADRLHSQKRLSLVLDLDHTLVHATNDGRARHYLHREDVRSLILPMLDVSNEPLWMPHFVKFRPCVKEFFESLQPLYEIGVYTAGTREYAEQITIILSRHLVGASMDYMDLDQLRRQVFAVEAEVKRTKELAAKQTSSETNGSSGLEKDSQVEAVEMEPHLISAKSKPIEQAQEPPESMDVDGATEKRKRAMFADGSEDTSVKRRRVTFGDAPPSLKTDQLTEQHAKELRQQLTEAERLEELAQEMRQRVFGGRIVSRTDVGDLGRDVKSLKRIFPCGGTMAAVVDDREDVWANASDVQGERRGEPPENLLLVRPYHWNPFLGFADVNNAAGSDLSGGPSSRNGGDTEQESDEQLLWIVDILKRAHYRYYEAEKEPLRPTMPQIFRKMRTEVLAGSEIVLSGLVPLHKQRLGTHGPRPPVVRYVESLGAKLSPVVTRSTTHVVAAKDGTDKILAARRLRGCAVVKASWLMECVWTLTRRDESSHLLGMPKVPVESKSREPLAISQRENSSSSDDEDDDLAAEFENELMEDGG